MDTFIWGIDLGGTKIEGVILKRTGTSEGLPKTMSRIRIPTEANQGYNHIISQIDHLVRLLADDSKLPLPDSIGIGTPGTRSRSTGLMKNCNTTCLNGKDLKSDIEASLRMTVNIANDADCFALAEATFGAGKGYFTVFGVNIGTGVGGGIVVDGKLVSGPNGLSGEWGHMTLNSDGPECYCGRRGCVEKYLSGPAVEEHYTRATGRRKNLKDIAGSTDMQDSTTITWMCENFGRALAQVVNVLDPEVIVLGGGAGQVPQLRTHGLAKLRENVFGPDFSTPVVLPELGDSAGVFGAALLCDHSGNDSHLTSSKLPQYP